MVLSISPFRLSHLLRYSKSQLPSNPSSHLGALAYHHPHSTPVLPPLPITPALIQPRQSEQDPGLNLPAPTKHYHPPGPPSTPTPALSLPPSHAHNQDVRLDPDLSAELQTIVQSFKPKIRYAFAYGSGVFPQTSYSADARPMLDFIFAVSHPSHWHALNLQHNPAHYSLPARLCGSGGVSWLQERGPGAGVWFNVEAVVAGKVIKYGVVSVDTLCADLLDWRTLYVAGRMHKPTQVLRDDGRVRLAAQVNLAAALRTALLLLPARVDERSLYTTIAGLSYTGDFRTRWAEHPNKVNNIVDRQLAHFQNLYRPLLQALSSHLHISSSDRPSVLEQDSAPRARAELLAKLPTGLRSKIEADYTHRWNLQSASEKLSITDDTDLATRIVSDPKFEESVRNALHSIIARPALYQSLKGVLSAGPVKSFRYAGQKLMKRWKT